MSIGRNAMLCPDCMSRSFRLTSVIMPGSATVWVCERCGKPGQQDDFKSTAPEGLMAVGKSEACGKRVRMRGGKR